MVQTFNCKVIYFYYFKIWEISIPILILKIIDFNTNIININEYILNT